MTRFQLESFVLGMIQERGEVAYTKLVDIEETGEYNQSPRPMKILDYKSHQSLIDSKIQLLKDLYSRSRPVFRFNKSI